MPRGNRKGFSDQLHIGYHGFLQGTDHNFRTSENIKNPTYQLPGETPCYKIYG